jgi:hypothetical protein
VNQVEIEEEIRFTAFQKHLAGVNKKACPGQAARSVAEWDPRSAFVISLNDYSHCKDIRKSSIECR